jgi:hypothetical protein
MLPRVSRLCPHWETTSGLEFLNRTLTPSQEQGGVVDTAMKVYGLPNVRVIDSSIVPIGMSAVSGNSGRVRENHPQKLTRCVAAHDRTAIR